MKSWANSLKTLERLKLSFPNLKLKKQEERSRKLSAVEQLVNKSLTESEENSEKMVLTETLSKRVSSALARSPKRSPADRDRIPRGHAESKREMAQVVIAKEISQRHANLHRKLD